MNLELKELNRKLEQSNPAVFGLLSEHGKKLIFPQHGIIKQTQEAKQAKINATIGIAKDDDNSIMTLEETNKIVGLKPEQIFPYESCYGNNTLRKIWQKLILQKNPDLKSNISLPVISNGITNGLFTAGLLFVSPNDEIILPNTFWENYSLIFENLFSAKIRTYNQFNDSKGLKPLANEDNFNLLEFEKTLTKSKTKKKIVLLNFPNNPTGYTISKKEAEQIVEIIKKSADLGNKILVLCDDAYFGMYYEDECFNQSIFSLLSDISENVLAVKLDGASKEAFFFGLRLGFITFGGKNLNNEAYFALENKTAAAMRATISSNSNLAQNLLIKELESKESEAKKIENIKILEKRYQKIKTILQDKKFEQYFTPLPFNSGFFFCLKLKNIDAENLRKILLEKYQTGVISSGKDLIRISYSSVPYEQLEQLIENIYLACATDQA